MFYCGLSVWDSGWPGGVGRLRIRLEKPYILRNSDHGSEFGGKGRNKSSTVNLVG